MFIFEAYEQFFEDFMDTALGLFVAAMGIIIALILAWRSDWWQRKIDRRLDEQGKRVQRVEIISKEIQKKILSGEKKTIQGSQSTTRQLPNQNELVALLKALPPLNTPIPIQLPLSSFARPLLPQEYLPRGIIIPPWPLLVWVDLLDPYQYFLVSELTGEILYAFHF